MEHNTSKESIEAGAAGLIKPVAQSSTAAPAAPIDRSTNAPVISKSGTDAIPATPQPSTAVQGTGPAVIVDTPLGKQTYGGAPLESIKLTSFADVQNFAKEYAGVELKEVQDFVPLLQTFKKTTEQAAVAAELQNKFEIMSSTLENLPKEVSLILNTAVSGGDAMAVIANLQKKNALEFDKPFESHDPLKLVNFYTNKSFTQETFDALDPASKDALTTSSKLRFDADRTEVLNFETVTNKATDERQAKFLASVDASILAWQASNPTLDKTAVAEVKKTMLYGLSNELFAKDKTYMPEAAEKIAMLKFGKVTIANQAQTLGDLVKKIQNSSTSTAMEKIVLRSDKPQITGGGQNANNNLVAAEVDRATSFLRKK